VSLNNFFLGLGVCFYFLFYFLGWGGGKGLGPAWTVHYDGISWRTGPVSVG
jgi:hypothetical protein